MKYAVISFYDNIMILTVMKIIIIRYMSQMTPHGLDINTVRCSLVMGINLIVNKSS